MVYIQKNNPFTNSPFKQETITGTHGEMSRKARMMRPNRGEYIEGQKKGTHSTHLMATYTGEGGKHYVAPTITNITESGEYEPQDFQRAMSAGEVFEFNSKEEAEKFAKGSWKLKLASDLHKDIKNK